MDLMQLEVDIEEGSKVADRVKSTWRRQREKRKSRENKAVRWNPNISEETAIEIEDQEAWEIINQVSSGRTQVTRD